MPLIYPHGTITSAIVACPKCGAYINLKISNKCYYCGFIYLLHEARARV
jgi:hypothetical protein